MKPFGKKERNPHRGRFLTKKKRKHPKCAQGGKGPLSGGEKRGASRRGVKTIPTGSRGGGGLRP